MHLLQLERILLVAETGNITEAAKSLFISQPSMSQTIQHVEEEIGASIFDRRTAPLKLTPEGEIFIRSARQIVDIYRAMMKELHDTRSGITGKIKIGVSIPRSHNIMAHVLPEMKQAYPHVILDLVDGLSQEFEQKILLGNLTFALSNIPPSDSHVGCHVLNEERYYLVANRNSALAQRLDAHRASVGNMAHRFSIMEAADEDFIVLHPDRNSRVIFNKLCQENGFSPKISLEVYNSNIATNYVESGLGVTLIASTSSNLSPFPWQTEQLSFFELTSKHTQRDLYLYYPASVQLSPAQEHLISLLLKHFSQQRPQQGGDALESEHEHH